MFHAAKVVPCDVQNILIFFNILEKNAARLIRKTGLGSMAASGFPDCVNAKARGRVAASS
jgi:hypothetical protein